MSEECLKHYIIVDPKEIAEVTKYFRDHNYKYYVESWTSSPIPFDDEDDEVIELHVIFDCNDFQYGVIQERFGKQIFLYFGKE